MMKDEEARPSYDCHGAGSLFLHAQNRLSVSKCSCNKRIGLPGPFVEEFDAERSNRIQRVRIAFYFLRAN